MAGDVEDDSGGRVSDRLPRWHVRRPAAPPETDPEAQQDAESLALDRLAHRVADPTDSGRPQVQVPWPVDLAAAWAWRLIVIAVAALGLLWLVNYFAVIAFPLVVAAFLTALGAPFVAGMMRVGIPRKLAALVTVIAGLGVISALLTFVGRQISSQSDELADKLVEALEEVRGWLQTGPLHATDLQISEALDRLQDWLAGRGADLTGKVPELGIAVSHTVAGFFIILFATYFFLADGRMIWSWLVRIFPRTARPQVDSSGDVAWTSMTKFVHATVLVAATDAIGVMLVALILKVPLVSAIGVIVFLGAFVPIVGAFVSGAVAVLLALVAQGPLVALLMFGGVVVVAQVEAHVLQPFLMGRFVSVHPLGVIIAIAAGILVAGIPGALVAVPLAAALNAVVLHLANGTDTPSPEPSEPSALDGEEADA